MNRVIHFEIQADDPERAATFYREVFGWNIEKWADSEQEYWVVRTADQNSTEPGINGGLLKRPAKTPPQECGTNAYVCTVGVESFDEIAGKIEVAGGLVAMPKFALTGMAWQGYFLDTEGNTFGIHQSDENAK
ncbi:MAG: VOC family protein [Candidatus Andersenbacteria bacterium]